MNPLADIGRTLLVVGIVAIVAGSALLLTARFGPLPRLPGDIVIRGDRFTFFAPIATSLVISVVLTLILNLLARLKG
jgi:hypothetical protein